MKCWWLALTLTGCTGEPEETGTIASADCLGGTPPVLEELYCENTGVQTYALTGEDVPTLTLWVDVSDEDGDLTTYSAQVGFDEELDGVVDLSTSELSPSYGSVHADLCAVPSLILGVTLYLRGGEPLYETTYEWGVEVTDDSGQSSDVAVVVCTTPDESGAGAVQ